jgi:hypothetical protein
MTELKAAKPEVKMHPILSQVLFNHNLMQFAPTQLPQVPLHCVARYDRLLFGSIFPVF